MIATLRSLAWLRWRMMWNTVAVGRKRDLGETASRIAQILVPTLLAIIMIPISLGLAVLAVVAGYGSVQGDWNPDGVVGLVRILGLILTGLVVVWPLVRSLQGGMTGLTRLLLLPIPRRLLHAGEVLSGLADPWIAMFGPALLLVPVGVGVAGSLLGGTFGLLAALTFVLLLLAAGSCAAFGLHLLLRDRKRAERIVVLAVVGLLVLSYLPGLMLSPDGDRDRDRDRDKPTESAPQEAAPASSERARLPRWILVLPSELMGASLQAGMQGEPLRGLLCLGGLAAEAGLLLLVSSRLYRRAVETPAGGSRRRSGPRRSIPLRTLPGLGAGASAVASAQIRTLRRTVKGKIALYFSPIFILLFGTVLYRQFEALRSPDFSFGLGPAALFAAAFFSIMGMQPILLNLFATDGSGLTLQMLSPISEVDLIRGKLAAISVLVAIPALVAGTVAGLLTPPASPWEWLAAGLGGAATYLLFAPAGAFLSTLFPRTADLNSIGSAGNPHSLASLLGLLIAGSTAGPSVALTLLAARWGAGPWAGALLVAGWAAVAWLMGHLLIQGVARTVMRRREALLLAAQGR